MLILIFPAWTWELLPPRIWISQWYSQKFNPWFRVVECHWNRSYLPGSDNLEMTSGCARGGLDWISGRDSSPKKLSSPEQQWSHCSWRDFKDTWMQHLGTWFSGGIGSAGLMVGLGDLRTFPAPRDSALHCCSFSHSWYCSIPVMSRGRTDKSEKSCLKVLTR